jgi:hypothetical protein
VEGPCDHGIQVPLKVWEFVGQLLTSQEGFYSRGLICTSLQRNELHSEYGCLKLRLTARSIWIEPELIVDLKVLQLSGLFTLSFNCNTFVYRDTIN